LDFRDQSKPLMVASMVQDDKVVFSLGRPQPPPDGLNKPYPRPGRPRIDNAANVEVNTFGPTVGGRQAGTVVVLDEAPQPL
jgi:hypothetical protein